MPGSVAVIGTPAVSLTRIAPHAVPDPFAAVMFVVAMAVLLGWRVASLQLAAAGALIEIVRRRLGAAWDSELPNFERRTP
jgi:hypothetical protein